MKNYFIGKKIGNVLVIKVFGSDKHRKKIYECKCDCGNLCYLGSQQLLRNPSPKCKECGKTTFKDHTGKRFGRLIVIKRDNTYIGKKVRWICKCDCGKIKKVFAILLTEGKTKSCGCLQKESKSKNKIDLSGKRYGKLVVIQRDNKDNQKWICKCDCGTQRSIYVSSLRMGLTKSCGCSRIEMLSGKNSRFWRGGLTKLLRRKKKESAALAKWGRHVKKRDKYKCRKCGNSKLLNAHHIFDYATHHDIAFNIDNGATLCQICHSNFHKKYFYKFNNRKQFDRFMKE